MLIPLPTEALPTHSDRPCELKNSFGFQFINPAKIVGISVNEGVSDQFMGIFVNTGDTLLVYSGMKAQVIFVYRGNCANDLRRIINQLERDA